MCLRNFCRTLGVVVVLRTESGIGGIGGAGDSGSFVLERFLFLTGVLLVGGGFFLWSDSFSSSSSSSLSRLYYHSRLLSSLGMRRPNMDFSSDVMSNSRARGC